MPTSTSSAGLGLRPKRDGCRSTESTAKLSSNYLVGPRIQVRRFWTGTSLRGSFSEGCRGRHSIMEPVQAISGLSSRWRRRRHPVEAQPDHPGHRLRVRPTLVPNIWAIRSLRMVLAAASATASDSARDSLLGDHIDGYGNLVRRHAGVAAARLVAQCRLKQMIALGGDHLSMHHEFAGVDAQLLLGIEGKCELGSCGGM